MTSREVLANKIRKILGQNDDDEKSVCEIVDNICRENKKLKQRNHDLMQELSELVTKRELVARLQQREIELMAQVESYQEMSSQLYQATGAYDMPESVLDNLLDMANGDTPRHKDILPIHPPQQSLAEHDAEVIMKFANELGVYDSAYDDQEYIEVPRYRIKEYIDQLRQQADKDD